MGRLARAAARVLASSSVEQRNEALLQIRAAIAADRDAILAANEMDPRRTGQFGNQRRELRDPSHVNLECHGPSIKEDPHLVADPCCHSFAAGSRLAGLGQRFYGRDATVAPVVEPSSSSSSSSRSRAAGGVVGGRLGLQR